jgi:hypothetical protein
MPRPMPHLRTALQLTFTGSMMPAWTRSTMVPVRASRPTPLCDFAPSMKWHHGRAQFFITGPCCFPLSVTGEAGLGHKRSYDPSILRPYRRPHPRTIERAIPSASNLRAVRSDRTSTTPAERILNVSAALPPDECQRIAASAVRTAGSSAAVFINAVVNWTSSRCCPPPRQRWQNTQPVHDQGRNQRTRRRNRRPGKTNLWR